MFFTVASFKSGVGKSTTDVQLAAYFQERLGSTLLFDGDRNRSVSGLAKSCSFPLPVVLERFKILLTIVPPKPNNDGEDARKMIEEAGLPIFKGEIP